MVVSSGLGRAVEPSLAQRSIAPDARLEGKVGVTETQDIQDREHVPEHISADEGEGAPAIGEGIRRERQRRGMTLAQLASQVGLTVSAISQIERGASDPSISSLRRIAQAFDIPMFQFLVGSPRRDIVVRRAQRTKLTFPDRDLQYELVSADTSGEFEVLSLVMAPGVSTAAVAAEHAAEECSLVLRGRMLVEVAGAFYDLEAGDSIKIHRNLPHRFVNDSEAETEVITVLSPPRFF